MQSLGTIYYLKFRIPEVRQIYKINGNKTENFRFRLDGQFELNLFKNQLNSRRVAKPKKT